MNDTAAAPITKAITIKEAEALPGMLGRIASANLKAHGEYGYTDTVTGRKVMLIRKD